MEKYINEEYQPIFAWIIDLEEIVQYDVMCSSEESTQSYLGNSRYEFLGRGYWVGTAVATNNPETYKVSQDSRICSFFKKL